MVFMFPSFVWMHDHTGTRQVTKS